MYKNVRAIDTTIHKDNYVKETENYTYAKEIIHVPLILSEFYIACKDYPIVFAKDTKNNSWFATVILGFKEKENLFINEDGNWEKNKYVPAYIRRYPFVLLENTDTEQYTLAIEESYLTEEKNDRKLFEENEKSEYLNNVLGFLTQFNDNAKATNLFIKQLEDWELLEEKRISIVTPNKEEFHINGFYVINEEKLSHLSKKKKEEICDKNANSLITAHLISLSNIQRIF